MKEAIKSFRCRASLVRQQLAWIAELGMRSVGRVYGCARSTGYIRVLLYRVRRRKRWRRLYYQRRVRDVVVDSASLSRPHVFTRPCFYVGARVGAVGGGGGGGDGLPYGRTSSAEFAPI